MEKENERIDRENLTWIEKRKITSEKYMTLKPNERLLLNDMIRGQAQESDLQRFTIYQKLAGQEWRNGSGSNYPTDKQMDEFFSNPLTPGEKLAYPYKF